MSNFIYAIENVKMVGPSQLEEAGLSGIFNKTEIWIHTLPTGVSQRYSTAGPGGECILFAADIDVKLLHYKPNEQMWKKSINGKFYVGLYKNFPPTEQNLRRKKQMAGHEVELAGGEKWLVPVARIITGGSALPQSLILGKNGEVFTEALPKYAQFSSKVEKLWEDFQCENNWKQGRPKLSITERMEFAIEALGWNYKVGPNEVNLLKLITTDNLSEILAAIIDVPTILEVSKQMADEKKNTDDVSTKDGSSSGSGAGDS